jgi:hypothetical protein
MKSPPEEGVTMRSPEGGKERGEERRGEETLMNAMMFWGAGLSQNAIREGSRRFDAEVSKGRTPW